jgi:hypothetical protein
MKKYALILLIVLTIFGCSNFSISDRNIQNKAKIIATRFDDNSVNIFTEWTYWSRGHGIWFKLYNHSISCASLHSTGKDSAILSVYKPSLFFQDFPCNFYLDTSLYYWIDFIRTQKTVCINAYDTNKISHTLRNDLPIDSIFLNENPFYFLNELNSIIENLGILIISYNLTKGDFIKFYLSTEHVLIFLPDKSKIDLSTIKMWAKEIENCKIIKKHWYLCKLKQPIDIG